MPPRGGRRAHAALAVLTALLALLAGPCGAQPRGSTIVGKPGVRSAAPPVLSSLSPSVGVREGGVTVTLVGAGFQRTRGLSVRFSTVGGSVVVPATFVDASTIVCAAPPQQFPGSVHVTASNDGAVFSAPPRVTTKGAGSFLIYQVVDARPWGQWTLVNDTFPAQGGSRVEVQLRGLLNNGEPDGGVFLDTGLAYCAFSASLVRVFSRFSAVAYTPGGAATGALGEAALALVGDGVGPAWSAAIQTDQTYELQAVSASNFTWRRYPRGAPPLDASDGWSVPVAFGLSVELEYGVTVGVPAAAAGVVKAVGDTWVFDALTANPTVTAAQVLTGRDASCPVPAYAAAAPDADPATPGLQHEVKVSLRGAAPFSPVTLYAQPATGAVRTATPLSRDTVLLADGFYTGDVAMTYEVWLSNATDWQWRRYSGGTPTSLDTSNWATAQPVTDAVGAWAALDQGVYVRFETAGGKSVDLAWQFTAYPAWSTPFSPVTWLNDTSPSTPVPATRLLPSGVPQPSAGAASWVYLIAVQADGVTFKWQKWPYGADATSPLATNFSAALAVNGTGGPVALEAGISVAWSAPAAVAALHEYQFTAFAGHVITYGAASALGAVVAAANNTVGDPGAPVPTDAAGNVFTPAYTGTSMLTFELTVGATGNSFSWSTDGGVTSSAEIAMAAEPTALTQGVYVTWPGSTSGYTAGNTYSFWAVPVASSTAPPEPEPESVHGAGLSFSAVGVFGPGGAPPARDTAVTLEFLNGTFFAYRVDTGPLSAALGVGADATTPVLLGDTGLALLFSASSGYTPGAKHVLWVTSFAPRVANATSAHGGTRAAPLLGTPVPARTNRGAPTGLALPYAANTGATTLGLRVSPTPGFAAAGAAQGLAYQTAAAGGLAAALPEGYPAAIAPGAYPTLYLRILGQPRVGAVTGPLPGALTIGGTYAGPSSVAYTLQVLASGADFQWRAVPLDGSSSGSWVNDTLASPTFDAASGLTITFGAFSYPTGTTWSFVAAAGHSYAYRRAGSAKWSGETVIAPGLVDLCCGVSVTFDALSGYTSGDQWVLMPFSLAPQGAYSGEADAVFEVQVLPGTAGTLPDTAGPGFIGAGTGTAAALSVGGNYTGTSTFVYEVMIADNTTTPDTFQWRRYAVGFSGGVYSDPVNTSLTPVALDAGLTLAWGATSGRSINDTWTFTARAGDSFAWRKDGGAWSAPLAITGVGYVVGDPSNAGPLQVADPQLPNKDVMAGGAYSGETPDALYVVEILADGRSFRWRSSPPLAGLAVGDAHTAAVAADPADWSAAVAITDDEAQALADGVFVTFMAAPAGSNSSRLWPHGDTFYVPASAGTTVALAEGVAVTWSAPSGFAPNDTWAFTAAAALAARGPHEGGTQVRVLGDGFLPSDALRCRFTDAYARAPAVVPASYVSATEVRCRTPLRPQDGLTAAVPSRPGAPAVALAGEYSAPRGAAFALTVGSGLALTLDTLDEGAPGAPPPSLPLGNVTLLADGVTWVALTDGLVARFDAAGGGGGGDDGGYLPGDVYTFRAAALAAAALGDADAHPELQPGSIKPGVLTAVAVSNDGGVSWSGAPGGGDGAGLSRFFYSPVYVSPDGDDGGGDGTRAAPYRTLGRGVAAALAAPRAGPPGAPPGLGSVTDWDAIVLLPGRYAGAGNAGVSPGGRALLVSASARGAAVLDCAGAPGGDVLPGDKFAPPGPAGAGSLSLRGVATENCGAAYAGGAGPLAQLPQGHWWSS